MARKYGLNSKTPVMAGEDMHKRLMNSYKEVPDWWFDVVLVLVVGLGILTVRNWDTGLPVWGFLVVCFGMDLLLVVPEGILERTTNQRMSVQSQETSSVPVHLLTRGTAAASSTLLPSS
jgi:hypothetical protein